MIPELPVPAGDLWVCHGCQMIGGYAEAKAHEIARGHDIERLDDETAEAVRVERDRQSAEFIVGLRQVARLRQDQP